MEKGRNVKIPPLFPQEKNSFHIFDNFSKLTNLKKIVFQALFPPVFALGVWQAELCGNLFPVGSWNGYCSPWSSSS